MDDRSNAEIIATLEPRAVSVPSDFAFSPPAPTAVPAPLSAALANQGALPAHPSELHTPMVMGNAGAHLDQLVHFLETSRNPSTHPPQEISRSPPHDLPTLMLGGFSRTATHMQPLEVTPLTCDPKPSDATVSSGNWRSRETEAHLVPKYPTRGGRLQVLDPVIPESSYDLPSSSLKLTSPVGLQRSVGVGPSPRVDVSKHLNSTHDSKRPSLESTLKPEPVPKHVKQHLQPQQASTRLIQGGPRKSIPSQAQRMTVLFCQFAVATQDKLMRDHPMRAQANEKLRNDLREYLTLWNTRKMRAGNVFESVSETVRSCCPQAAKLDLITKFKTWYKALQQQKNESTAGTDAIFVQREQASLIPRQPMQLIRGKNLDEHSTTAPRPIVPPVQSWRSRTGTQDPDLGLPLQLPINAKRDGNALNLEASGPEDPYPHFTGGTHLQANLRNIKSGRNDLSRSEQARASKATRAEIFAIKKDAERKASHSQPAPAMNQTSVSVPPLPTSAKELIDAHSIGSGLENIAHLRRLNPSSLPEKASRVDWKDLPKAPTISKEGKIPLSPMAFRTAYNSSMETSCTEQKHHTSRLASRHAESHFRPLSTDRKRPLDHHGASHAGIGPRKLRKKSSKTIREGTRPGKNATSVSKKGSGCSTGPTSAQGKPRKGQTTAKNGKSRLVFGTRNRNNDTSAVANIQIRSNSHAKVARGVADDLALLGNVVDLEYEESFLAHDEKAVGDEDMEAVGYNDDLLLTAKALGKRMKAAARRNHLKERVSRDAMEIISLAVRERLKSILESLREASSIRLDAEKNLWITAVPHESVREKLESLFKEEERSLDVKAKLRLKKMKEFADIEAMRVSKMVGEENEKTPPLVASKAGRKARIAHEKSLETSNNNKRALSGVLAGIQKMRRKAIAEKPLGSAKALLPLIQGVGKLQKITSILPPLPTTSASAGITLRLTDELDRTNRKHEGLLKMGGLGATNGSHLPKGTVAVRRKNRKYGLTLKDCLFLMESDQTTRRSFTLYKWYGRLGASR